MTRLYKFCVNTQDGIKLSCDRCGALELANTKALHSDSFQCTACKNAMEQQNVQRWRRVKR